MSVISRWPQQAFVPSGTGEPDSLVPQHPMPGLCWVPAPEGGAGRMKSVSVSAWKVTLRYRSL